MGIDFKRIDSENDFELLCRDVFDSLEGYTVTSQPSIGPDGGRDMKVRIEQYEADEKKGSIEYLVSCKHYAKSGKSVPESDIITYREDVKNNNCEGFFLIISTKLREKPRRLLEGSEINTKFWEGSKLKLKIESCKNSKSIIENYNLKDPIENLFFSVEKVLLGEYHLPFEFAEK